MAAKYVKFLRGTPKAFQNLTKKDSDTLYFIAETESSDGTLYLGSKRIGGTGDLSLASIDELRDVLITGGLLDRSLLVYDDVLKQWTNKTIDELFPIFKGATSNLPGIPGLVPAPLKGETNKFLRSDGTWAYVNSSGNSDSNCLIKNVGSEFYIDNLGTLYLKSVPKDISLKDNTEFQGLEKSVTSLNDLLNTNIEKIDNNIKTIEEEIKTLRTISVTNDQYNSEVGDLSKLNRVSGNPEATLVDEINSLIQRFSWQDL